MSLILSKQVLEQIKVYKKLSDKELVQSHYKQKSSRFPMMILIEALDSELKRRKIRYTAIVDLKIEKTE